MSNPTTQNVTTQFPNFNKSKSSSRTLLLVINYVDTYFRSGFYPSPKPEVLGREGVGTIVRVGSDVEQHDLKVGDRVAWLETGGYAEYSVAQAQKTIRLLREVSFQDAAGSFLGGLTILSMLDDFNVKQQDWVLLQAAAGSVGLLMVQILKLRGATLICTAGGPSKVAAVKKLGADHVIDYTSQEGRNWVEKVKELTGGRGVDVVFDSVARDTWEGSLDSVR